MLSTLILLFSLQGFFQTGESFITPTSIKKSRFNSHNTKNLIDRKCIPLDDIGDIIKQETNKFKSEDLITKASFPFACAWGLFAGACQAANIGIIDTVIDMEHRSLINHVPHNHCLPAELTKLCPVDSSQNINLLSEEPYSMNKHIRSWYHHEFGKYNKLHEMPVSQLSDNDMQWLVKKMNDRQFSEDWQRYMHASHGTHVAGIISQDNAQAKIFSIRYLAEDDQIPHIDFEYFHKSASKELSRSQLKNLAKKHLLELANLIVESNQLKFKQLADYLNERDITVVNGSYSTHLGFIHPYRELFDDREFLAIETQVKSIIFRGNLALYQQLIEKTPKILYVFAAGNDGSCNDLSPVFPSFMSSVSDRVISVASVDADGKLSKFSNYGMETVDIAAQGRNIRSTAPGNKRISMSGTSQAAPQVARVAAKIHDINEDLSPEEVKNIILETLDQTDELKAHVKYGGELNEQRALDRAASL